MLLENQEALGLLKNAAGIAAGDTEELVVGLQLAPPEFFRWGTCDLNFRLPDDSSRHVTPEKVASLSSETTQWCLLKTLLTKMTGKLQRSSLPLQKRRW